jgi:nitrogenase molybdenum-iron protein NifN
MALSAGQLAEIETMLAAAADAGVLADLRRRFPGTSNASTCRSANLSTVLGGFENVEQAIVNIAVRTKPDIIGICSTGVTETKGDDVDGFIKLIRQRHPEFDKIAIVYVSTPDFKGAFEDGWSKTVAKLVEEPVEAPAPGAVRDPQQVNVLPGSHLTPGDIDELRDILDAFGLQPTFLPDLAGSLDGNVPDDVTPTTHGGVSVAEIAAMGTASSTIAIGEQMRAAALALQAKAGVPFVLFDRLTGLAPNDEMMATLARISGRPVPAKYRRQRSQLVDAMLDAISFSAARRSPSAPSPTCCGISAPGSLRWAAGSQRRSPPRRRRCWSACRPTNC